MSYRTDLESRIAKKTTKAIVDYDMIQDGDRITVGRTSITFRGGRR